MQLGGNTRVRSSPFGGAPAPAATPVSGGDDFFSGWEDPPMPAAAPKPPMQVSAPMSGPGVMPPGALPPQPQMHQQPQQVPQGMGVQAPAWGQQAPAAPQIPQMGSMFAAGMAAAAQASMAGGDHTAVGAALFKEGAGAVAKTGIASWFPYIFASLQGKFNVGHGFVMRKLLLLLCPFVQKDQGAPSDTAWNSDDTPGHKNTGTLECLKTDINESDLYIPLMSYFTYCLVYCVQRGILSEFKPEVLAATISFAMVLFFLEVIVARMAFFIAGSQVSVLDLIGSCGYKFVHVLLMVILRILVGSSYFYYIPFLYLAACSGWALRRFMSNMPAPPMQQQYGQPPSAMHNHIILGLAVAQIPLCWLLTPSAQAKLMNASGAS